MKTGLCKYCGQPIEGQELENMDTGELRFIWYIKYTEDTDEQEGTGKMNCDQSPNREPTYHEPK